MRSIKMLGLTALAALMAMAFIGASSATAEPTVLCTSDEEECAEGNIVTHVHESSVVKATLLNEFASIKCNVLYLGDVEEEGAPLIIKGTFTYSGCNNFCSITEENGPSLISVLKTATELASVTSEHLVSVNCPFLKCSYTGTGLEGHGLGSLISTPANGSIVISKQALAKEAGGALCPETAELDIETTPLIPIAIRGWRHVCLYVGTNNGFYLASNGTGTACEAQHATRIGSYELALVRPRTGRGVHVCGFVGTGNGFFLLTNLSGLACTMKHETRTNSRYELGVTA